MPTQKYTTFYKIVEIDKTNTILRLIYIVRNIKFVIFFQPPPSQIIYLEFIRSTAFIWHVLNL